MISASPSATFDPSAASSYSPTCPAMAEINATPIAAAVNDAGRTSNRKDFFLGKKENILNRNSDVPDDLREHRIGFGALAAAAPITPIERAARGEDGGGE